MRDFASREFWQTRVPLWRLIVIVLAVGTVPSFAASAIVSGRLNDQAHAQLETSQSQLRQGCQRGNALRDLLNRRAAAVEQLRTGLVDFMAQARRARLNKNGTSYDPALANRYQRDISKVAGVPNEQLALVDCTRAFRFVTVVPPLRPHTALVEP